MSAQLLQIPRRSNSNPGETAALLQALQALPQAGTLDAVQAIVNRAAQGICGSDGVTFMLRDGEHSWCVDERAIGPLWKGQRSPIRSSVSGWTMRHRQPVVIPDIEVDPRVPADYRQTFVRSLVVVPMRQAEPIGAIGSYWARPHQPSPQQVEMLQALADAASIAIENLRVINELEQRVRERTAELEQANAEIRRQAVTDELTGLLNRRGFYLLGEQALRSARRLGSPCLLAFLDLDGLKQINDQHGHEAGHRMLRDFAAVLRSALREADIIGRIGGDEFCILSLQPGGDADGLRRRLQSALARYNREQQPPLPMAASLGTVLVPRPGADTRLDQLVEMADQRMYEDKRRRKAGRRRPAAR